METSHEETNSHERSDARLSSLDVSQLSLAATTSESLGIGSLTSNTRSASPEDDQLLLIEEPLSIEAEEEILHHQRRLTRLMSEEDESEFIDSLTWREQEHVFVLTEAGKPVYSRHGSEDKLSSKMAVILAIVSCVQDRNDTIRSIVAGSHKFVFLIKIPLILVAVCSTSKTIEQVKLHLGYVYDSIISVVTLSQLNRIYETKKNFDLRRLLTGTDKFLDHLCNDMDSDPQYLLGAVKSLPITVSVRDQIGQALQQAKTDDLVYAVLVSSGKVVSVCHMKQHKLETTDLQLLLNLVTGSSTSFLAGESWFPLCLPRFSPNGHLYAHISYLDENLQTCLILLSADKDAFFTLCECKKKVVAKLNKHNCLQALRVANSKEEYTVKKLNISDARHFLYKSVNPNHTPCEYTSPTIDTPYNTTVQQQRLFNLYQHLHGKIHNPSAPLKLHYCVSDQESLLAWVATGFELYAVFNPMVTKHQAIAVVDKILRWIKQGEDRIFMKRTAVF